MKISRATVKHNGDYVLTAAIILYKCFFFFSVLMLNMTELETHALLIPALLWKPRQALQVTWLEIFVHGSFQHALLITLPLILRL